MIRNVYIILVIIALPFFGWAQTSSQDGDWQDNASWSGGSAPPVTGIGNPSIVIDHDIQVGSYGNDVGLSFAANNNSRSITINTDKTLIIYGDVDFANKAMDLVIEGTVIILGDLDLNNKIDISSNGTLVVSGTFNKNGSQGSYTGTGTVYAGGYSGDAENLIPGNNSDTDQQQLISDLGPDGLTDIEAFVNSGGENPLPITLSQFKLEHLSSSVKVVWTTESEEDFDYFAIERADASGDFKEVTQVQGAGNSKTTQHYTWTDKNPRLGINYYRIKAVDLDGSSEIFPSAVLNFQPESNQINIHPNPATIGSQLNISGNYDQTTRVTIFDLEGRIAYQHDLHDGAQLSIPSEIKSGTYLMHVDVNGLITTTRLILR